MKNHFNIFHFIRHNLEAIIWIVALVLLAMMEPGCEHSSLCPFKAMGLSFCPGCGLGHSISYFFHGELRSSFYAHPLGIFAVIILFYRSIRIFIRYFKNRISLNTN